MSHFITKRNEIEAWLDRACIKNYTISPSGVVDVAGSVLLDGPITGPITSGGNRVYIWPCGKLGRFPIQFGVVSGNFSCRCLGLSSLDGSPKEVGGDFNCCHNQLISLIGAPIKIGGTFIFYSNLLVDFVGFPNFVGGEIIPLQKMEDTNTFVSDRGMPDNLKIKCNWWRNLYGFGIPPIDWEQLRSLTAQVDALDKLFPGEQV